MLLKDKNVLKIFKNVASYSSVYIFGPIFFFGLIGYFADKRFDSEPKFLFISIGIAFLVSNALLFKKRNFLSKKMMERIVKKSK